MARSIHTSRGVFRYDLNVALRGKAIKMFAASLYYKLKPYLPWTLRVGLRRMRAARVRASHEDVWPINERAAAAPPNWPGWPAGKRFAFVLTHDVEGSKGLSRVEDLMKVEQNSGFRSSFNFVPEGQYRVPDSLIETLDHAGFEVGIHGLQHDGRLYLSKTDFAAKAARIREYAKRWKASGFRSPFMQHKLSWLHELGMEYDASSFDTDPFEPQPDAVDTIFPFWVPGPEDGGFVELPYSLPQDFTLFVVLKERNVDIWKRKIDWVAANGGMVLLNTHPDYNCFEGQPEPDEYPIAYYKEVLQYVADKYKDAYWHALPREVARYYRSSISIDKRNTRKKICMVAYTRYDSDNRVRRYAEALVGRGDQVDVIALAGGDSPLGSSVLKGVKVYHVQRREKNEKSKWDYISRLLRFFAISSAVLTREHYKKRYDLIHVHNIPDFLIFTAWYPKRLGVRTILDIHDIVPELYLSKFEAGKRDPRIGVLRYIERASARFADHVIVSNDLWYETLLARSVSADKCSVFLNHVDKSIFFRRARTRVDDKFVMLFPGSFQWHQGLDIAIKAFARIAGRVPNAEFHLYGGGQEEAKLRELSDRLGINERVKFCASVDLDQIPALMANADLGVVPKRADSFGNEAYSTKIMEFMSQGVPVLASKTKIDGFYFDDSVIRFFPSGDDLALADAMIEVIENPSLCEARVCRASLYVDRNSWDERKPAYFELVDSLSTETFN